MPAVPHLRLGVNIDHVATIRNARGGRHPERDDIDARRDHRKGETLYVTTDPEHVHVFDTDSGKRLTA